MDEVKNTTATPSDLSAMLGSLLQDPDALSRVSGIISQYTGAENSSTEQAQSTPEAEPTQVAPKLPLPDLLSMLHASAPSQNKEQTALLLAIKPYLSEHRRELIDGFIKMSRLTDILKKLT